MSSRAELLRRAVLRHAPQRHGLMLAPNQRAKYHEIRRAPTDQQLIQHLAGEITLAAPTTANGLAGCIVFDIDGEGIDTIPALLEAARQRGLWAWGEWHEAINRGYVWIPFDRLTHTAALAELGRKIVTSAELRPEQLHVLDQRTANNAITRLPFGRHTHTDQRGEIILQDGTSAALDGDPDAALTLWASSYRENPVPALPDVTEIVASRKPRNYPSGRISAAEIQQRYNEGQDVCAILATAGGRRHARTSWHCPCGHHQHGDRSASLLIRPADQAKYGAFVVQGYAPGCLFHHETHVFDAFNVYRLLHGLSNTEMLQHARRTLGLNAPERPQTHQKNWEGGQTHPTGRPTSQRPRDAMSTPLQDMPSAAEVLTRAGRDSSLSPATRTVLTTILDILSDRPSARIRLASLISQTGLARRTIQAALRRLEAAGYLMIAPQENEYGGHVANQYTLSAGGGRSNRSPLNIKACKGGQPAQPSAKPMAAPAISAPAPAAPQPPFRVESAPVAAPSAEMPPPFHVPASSDVPQTDESATEAASFDPAIYNAWAAALDEQAERSWSCGRSPRQVMQGHEYGLAELKRTQAERGPLVTPPVLPAAPPVSRLRQSMITVAGSVVAPTAVQGVHGLRAELARLEREARRYFAQKAPIAGKQTQQRAAALRRQLAELEANASGLSAPSEPQQWSRHQRQRSYVQGVLTTE